MSNREDSQVNGLVPVLQQVREAVESALGNVTGLSVNKVTVTLKTTLTASGSGGPTFEIVEIDASGELTSEHTMEIVFVPSPRKQSDQTYTDWPDDLLESVRTIEAALEATAAGYQRAGLKVSEASVTLSFSVDAKGGIKIFGLGGSVERQAVHEMELKLAPAS